MSLFFWSFRKWIYSMFWQQQQLQQLHWMLAFELWTIGGMLSAHRSRKIQKNKELKTGTANEKLCLLKTLCVAEHVRRQFFAQNDQLCVCASFEALPCDFERFECMLESLTNRPSQMLIVWLVRVCLYPWKLSTHRFIVSDNHTSSTADAGSSRDSYVHPIESLSFSFPFRLFRLALVLFHLYFLAKCCTHLLALQQISSDFVCAIESTRYFAITNYQVSLEHALLQKKTKKKIHSESSSKLNIHRICIWILIIFTFLRIMH